MATMDIIARGGAPANLTYGGANADQIKNAFRILLADRTCTPVSSILAASWLRRRR
jgi:succinyl-CoA synthetase beta subunit